MMRQSLDEVFAALADPRATSGRRHPLAAYAHEARSAIGPMAVDARTNEHKAALERLGVLPGEGKVVIGDAAFRQRDLSRKMPQQKAMTPGRSRTISAGSLRGLETGGVPRADLGHDLNS